ncbi:MAG: hypothetical protein JSS14_18470 [Proteobacteria bacterium]|nr:hypothetical protein [Pseudomonadota bacterium]
MSDAQILLVWQVAVGSLLALVLLWWLARGARRWARQRSLRQALARNGNLTRSALDQAFAQARQALQPGAARLRPQALYDRPWMLFLGDSQSRVPELLAAAGTSATTYGDGAQSFWRWWPMPRMVAIETDPRLVEPGHADTPAGRELSCAWYQALLVLAERRGAQPLDAVALCVDAQCLMAGPQAAADLALRLRRRADEASQHLRLRLSTQILVTGLDRLPGYATVCRALPPEVLAQAVGFRVPAGTLVIVDNVLADLAQRLQALRMALLRQQPDAQGRLAVHEFFTQWVALHAGLAAFLKQLFTPGSTAFRLRGRALYFVAAPPAGTSPPAFAAELFTRFLPLERAY